jgi:glycosyltransferase involved in cell wall biosynthesis
VSPEASVVICAYTLDRWVDLQRSVESVVAQRPSAREIIVVVDHNAELLDRAHARWGMPGPVAIDDSLCRIRVIANQGARGLSGARNTGVAVSCSEIVAFLDDDAEAEEGWIERLLAPYADPHVAACGGAAMAALAAERPNWWPVEFDWVVGCSYRGLPTTTAAVRNLIGANMSARRAVLVDLDGFPEGIGRVGTRPVGCEETDLFIRLAQRWPDALILYEPAAVVRHTVPVARLSWRYFRRRCFAEGLSKAKVAARVGRRQALSSERSYTLRVLPRGMAAGLRGACRGEAGSGRRAVAIGAGLALTTAGYLCGQLATSVTARSPASRAATPEPLDELESV